MVQRGFDIRGFMDFTNLWRTLSSKICSLAEKGSKVSNGTAKSPPRGFYWGPFYITVQRTLDKRIPTILEELIFPPFLLQKVLWMKRGPPFNGANKSLLLRTFLYSKGFILNPPRGVLPKSLLYYGTNKQWWKRSYALSVCSFIHKRFFGLKGFHSPMLLTRAHPGGFD